MALGQRSLLELTNGVLRRLGKAQTTATISSASADSWVGIVRETLEEAQHEIAKEHDWSTLFTTGTFTTSSRTYDLSTDFSNFQRMIALKSTTNDRVLTPVNHLDIDEFDPTLDDAGAPWAYAIAYPNLLFNVTPTSEAFAIRYIKRHTQMSANADVSSFPEYCDLPLVWWCVWQLYATREDAADGGVRAEQTYRATLAAAIAQDKRRVDKVEVMQPVFGRYERAIVPFPAHYESY